MKDLGSWHHLFRKRKLDEEEYERPATLGDIARVSDQTLRRIIILVGLMLLVSGSLYWNQGRQGRASDQALVKAALANANAQRFASIRGCQRQNQLRAQFRENLKEQRRADRRNGKLFQPEQFGLTEHQFAVLKKEATGRFRRALHRIQPTDCVAKYPPPRPPALSGD